MLQLVSFLLIAVSLKKFVNIQQQDKESIMRKETILKVINISKSFPGTKALSKVNLNLEKGEVHAIVGENGAGKSTLMNIISGFYKQDNGILELFGKEVNFHSPYDSQLAGIGIVHQEMANCPQISVAENMFMSAINKRKYRFVNYTQLCKKAEEVLGVFNLKLNPKQKVSELSISEQQVVEIAKALTLDCNIIIFDEPTASLTEAESETLFSIIADLKAKGISILYISHRMEEVFNHCDRTTVLRDGKNVETVALSSVTIDDIIKKMVGRNIGKFYPQKSQQTQDSILKVQNVFREGVFENISFELAKGEILGIAGLVGSGRTEVAKAICGIDQKDTGDIVLNGQKVRINSYKDAIKKGIVYLTEDRKKEGLFLKMSVKYNISALSIKQISDLILIDAKKENKQANKYCNRMNVKSYGIEQKAGTLSGGNQQKVLFSKLLSVQPKILFLDEPTRGIDIGAKAEIYNKLRDICNQGVGVVIISSDLLEIIGMCDRVLVMHEGRLTGILNQDEISEHKIIHLASGF